MRDRQYVLHDDTLVHSAITVKYFLVNHGMVEISHPPYSPDPLAVFYSLRGRKFEGVEDNKENLTAKLNAVPLDAFDCCFVQILLRCEKCVAVRQITMQRK
jgi:hypothetical protein